jgi:hypothetical protein
MLFDGTNDYLYHADHADFDILGNEGEYDSAIRGLTLGGWWWKDAHGANNKGLIGKWSSGADTAYLLFYGQSSDSITFGTDDGVTPNFAGPGITMPTGEWVFAVGRWYPGSEANVFQDGTKGTDTGSVTSAPLQNSTDNLEIGVYDGGNANYRLDGRAALVFICAVALPDGVIRGLYQHSRALFGK